MTRINTPSEHDEQSALIDWTILMQAKWPELKLFFHIPNEGKRSPAAALRLLSEGMKRGVPDNFLPVPRGGYHGLWIELKRTKNSSTTKEQKQWVEDLNAQGYMAVVCKGWEAASKVIEEYLEGKI